MARPPDLATEWFQCDQRSAFYESDLLEGTKILHRLVSQVWSRCLHYYDMNTTSWQGRNEQKSGKKFQSLLLGAGVHTWKLICWSVTPLYGNYRSRQCFWSNTVIYNEQIIASTLERWGNHLQKVVCKRNKCTTVNIDSRTMKCSMVCFIYR